MRFLTAFCLVMGISNVAAAQGLCGCKSQGCADPSVCGCSQKVCCPHVETEKIKKQCYEVGCKQICIPPVQCPCSKCCQSGCARVKNIHVLKKREYECGEKCVVKWKLEEACGTDCNSCVPASTPVPPAAPPAQSVSLPKATGPSAMRRFSLTELLD